MVRPRGDRELKKVRKETFRVMGITVETATNAEGGDICG